MEAKELLKSLEYLFLLLENGYPMKSFNIQKKANIDQSIWRKLINCQIIERLGAVRMPYYKWVSVQPDIDMATELLKDYPIFDNDKINTAIRLSKHPYFNQNTNIMLHEKDQMFNWVIPKSVSGKKITCDFKVNIKHNYIYLGKEFLKINYPEIDHSNVKAAFLLEGDKQFIVINPPQGVPFYKFSSTTKTGKQKNAGHNTPTLSSKQLTELIKIKFMITQLSQEFELKKFENINGMMFYQIVPVK